MLFASVDLAARIEAAECALLEACITSVAQARPHDAVIRTPIGRGLGSFAGVDSPLTKVAGLGFDAALDTEALASAEAACFAHDAAVQAEVSCLADPAVALYLSENGYRVVGFENVLGRAVTPDEPGPTEPTIALELGGSSDAEISQWLDPVATGFASPDTEGVESHEEFPRDAIEQAIGDMARADGFVRMLARRGDAIAGGASMRIHERIAQLCGAATVPAHRRHGVQTALLAARLRHAGRAGCDLAVVTTLPGSASQRNAQRRGFELLYTRAIFRRDSD